MSDPVAKQSQYNALPLRLYMFCDLIQDRKYRAIRTLWKGLASSLTSITTNSMHMTSHGLLTKSFKLSCWALNWFLGTVNVNVRVCVAVALQVLMQILLIMGVCSSYGSSRLGQTGLMSGVWLSLRKAHLLSWPWCLTWPCYYFAAACLSRWQIRLDLFTQRVKCPWLTTVKISANEQEVK